jgi:hypothetical protein
MKRAYIGEKPQAALHSLKRNENIFCTVEMSAH